MPILALTATCTVEKRKAGRTRTRVIAEVTQHTFKYSAHALARVIRLQQTTQDVDVVAAQSAISSRTRCLFSSEVFVAQKLHRMCFWSYSHMKPFHRLLSKEGHGASYLFPDEMCQESNMSSCRGFTVVSRHLVARLRLSEHVRETRKLHLNIGATKTFYLLPCKC